MHYIMVKNCRIEIKRKQLKNEVQKNDPVQNMEMQNYDIQNTYDHYDKYNSNNSNMRLKYDINNLEINYKMTPRSYDQKKTTLSTAEKTLPSGISHMYSTPNLNYDLSQHIHPRAESRSSPHYEKYHFENSGNYYDRKKQLPQGSFMKNSSFFKGQNRSFSELNNYNHQQNLSNKFAFDNPYLNNKNIYPYDNGIYNNPHSFILESAQGLQLILFLG